MPTRRRSVLPDRLHAREGASPQLEVLDELRRVIVEGGVPPGNPVPVGEVARVLGVSTIPVRESLRQLIGEGLIDHRPNLGFTVTQLTPAELSEIYLVRGSLENAAHGAAIKLATSDDDDAAKVACDALDEAIRTDDALSYHQFSRAFHIALVRPSRMGRLLHMLESAWNITEPVRPMAQIASRQRTALHLDHKEMLDAFTRRDADGLREVSARHQDRLKIAIADLPPESGLRHPD
ncbi:GntR family transcriptional regulator [Smaragdicoccus niigatensis]|uniref:GntR family transcriptional regulator n=1 Tax=Smaragdicoccus niigatensis TaxID=359359 RepID=UPI00037A7197|nr:GntR family transcriptional regulator [Smaragdicoccus niigatensis]